VSILFGFLRMFAERERAAHMNKKRPARIAMAGRSRGGWWFGIAGIGKAQVCVFGHA
jgi:hypothetical protein